MRAFFDRLAAAVGYLVFAVASLGVAGGSAISAGLMTVDGRAFERVLPVGVPGWEVIGSAHLTSLLMVGALAAAVLSLHGVWRAVVGADHSA